MQSEPHTILQVDVYLHNFEIRYARQFPWDWTSQTIAIEPPADAQTCKRGISENSSELIDYRPKVFSVISRNFSTYICYIAIIFRYYPALAEPNPIKGNTKTALSNRFSIKSTFNC
jgi:hypothetical protein